MKKVKQLVIVGAGELAQIAYEYFTFDSDYEVAGFVVERAYLKESLLCGKPIYPFEEIQHHFPPTHFDAFVAIPASQLNRLRARFYLAVKEQNYDCATYVSSHAFVWRNAHIGENCFIFENNTIQPFVHISDNVILWSGNHIGHRTIIREHCFLSSHVVVSGYCDIGPSSFLGVNATLNDHVSIPASTIIASGALVTKSLTVAERIYCGAPAKEVIGKTSFEVNL